MRLKDILLFAFSTMRRQTLRSAMLLLAIAIGVASVVIMTALGRGTENFVEKEFEFLGKDVLVVLPGRRETTGGIPPITGTATRDITIGDMEYVTRRVPNLIGAPLILGTSEVSEGRVNRETLILGTTPELFITHNLQLEMGKGLPENSAEASQAVCVIGIWLSKTLFNGDNPIGRWIRLDDRRFRVAGVFSSKSSNMGLKLDETVLIPVRTAQAVFNTPGLFRLFLQSTSGMNLDRLEQRVLQLIAERHQGVADVTVIRPDAMLSTFGDILFTLTLVVTGIGTISLVVAGILMMNIMLISTHQRAAEIGLLKALGATCSTIRKLFLYEAAILAVVGALLGIAFGYIAVFVAEFWLPAFPLQVPGWASITAFLISLFIGVIFALAPANRAAKREAVESLRGHMR